MFSKLAFFFHSFIAATLSPSAAGRARLCLAILGVFQIGFLIFAENPWTIGLVPEENPKPKDYVALYSWVATVWTFVGTVVLYLTADWWTMPLTRSKAMDESRLAAPRYFWPVVAGAMLFTACFAVPRMNHSLWDDEDYNVRYSILGRFQQDDDTGTVKFKKLSWLDTFYDYREPNNHVLHSLLARTSLGIWSVIARPSGFPFEEWPLRVPALLFGLAAIGTVAWFVKEYFGPQAGLIAAGLLSMHPWFIRYTSEARGYSMVLCLMPVAFVLWRRCLTDGSWKWWAAYAVVQWATIYTYPGVLFAFAMLNFLAMPLLAYSRKSAGPLDAQMGRWFAANCISAMAVFRLMLPLYPQAKAYLEYESSRNYLLGWSWIQSTLAFLAAGAPWAGETSFHPSLSGVFSSHPALLLPVLGGIVGLVVLGFFRFLKKDRITAALALVIVLPPVMTFGISLARRHLIYSSYVIYVLPGLVAFAAVGIIWFAREVGRLSGGRYFSVALTAALLAGFFFLTAPTRNWLAAHPLQPTKDSVLASRGTLDPWDAKADQILTASFCIPPYLYDANILRLNSWEELIALLRRADREQKTLVLNIGMPWAARAYSPAMWKLFNQPELFQDHKHMRGFDSGLDRIVATYIPGSADSFNFTEYETGGR